MITAHVHQYCLCSSFPLKCCYFPCSLEINVFFPCSPTKTTKITRILSCSWRNRVGGLITHFHNLSWLPQTFQVNIWASTRENHSSEVCKQQRCRPACASAQSDQRFCSALFGKYLIKACYERIFVFLASVCSLGDWFEYRFVGHPTRRGPFTSRSLSVHQQNAIRNELHWWADGQ